MHVQPDLAHNWLNFCYNTIGNCKYRAPGKQGRNSGRHSDTPRD
jgi:hypothetical protein